MTNYATTIVLTVCLFGSVGCSSTPSFRRPSEDARAASVDAPRTARVTTDIGRAAETSALSTGRQLSEARLASFVVRDESSLRATLALVTRHSGLSIFVQPEAEEAVQNAGVTFNLVWERPVPVTAVLDMICELSDGAAAWTVRQGVVFVSTPDRIRRNPRTRAYDISDLLRGVSSFPGREIAVSPSGGIVRADEDAPEPGRVINEELLMELIRNTIEPGSWDDGTSSIRIQNGKLIVTR